MPELNPSTSTVDVGHAMPPRWTIAGWALLYLLIAGALQYIIPFPWDDDTAYHAAVGQLISQHGILRTFPWTPFSILAEHYADKELLFHLLFVPFTGLGWVTAARIVGTLSGAGLLMALYLVLRTEKVRFAGLWAIIPLTASVLFFFRFILVRPHLLSITLALIVLWAASREKLAVLTIASAIYPWAYVAFWQIPCLMLLAAGTAQLLSGERVRWKPIVAVFAGVAIGLASHPNAANLLTINLAEMVDLLFKHSWGERTGFDAIAELRPYPLPAWIQGLLFSVLMTLAAGVYALRNRRGNAIAIAFSLAALGFCILTVKSARFGEYFVPFSVAAIALASRSLSWRYLPHSIAGITTAWALWVQPNMLSDLTKRPNIMPQPVASFLQQQIPPQAQIFNVNWDLAGWLMLTLPDRRLVVALDPTFLYKGDSNRYALWYTICHETPAGSADIIRQQFHARYVVSYNLPYLRTFFYKLSSEPGVRILLSSDTWMVFDLGDR